MFINEFLAALSLRQAEQMSSLHCVRREPKFTPAVTHHRAVFRRTSGTHASAVPPAAAAAQVTVISAPLFPQKVAWHIAVPGRRRSHPAEHPSAAGWVLEPASKCYWFVTLALIYAATPALALAWYGSLA
jgi:hypothetical protein